MFFLDYEYPSYDHRKFWDRFQGVWQATELNLLLLGPTNLIMRWATADIADFNMITYSPGSAFDFYDYPASITWPAPISNEARMHVCQYFLFQKISIFCLIFYLHDRTKFCRP